MKKPPRRSGFMFGRKKYVVVTRYANQKKLKSLFMNTIGEESVLEGLWDNQLGEGAPWFAGYVYIAHHTPLKKQWAIYDHEMRHAFHDILAWEGDL